MMLNRLCVLFCILFSLVCTYLNGQVQLGIFSYSEFLRSPNESYNSIKSFTTGYNKSNFSSNVGLSIDYKVNDEFIVSIGLQKSSRSFDCDCVDFYISKDVVYYISDTSYKYNIRSKYMTLQIPVSVKFLLSAQHKSIKHYLGIGNTFVYSLERQELIFNDVVSFEKKSIGTFISTLSPEIYYQLSIVVLKRAYIDLSIGIREEISNQTNHVFWGKLGLGYSFGKIPKIKRKRK